MLSYYSCGQWGFWTFVLLFFRELSLVYLLKCGIIKSWTRWSPRYSGKQSKPGKPQLTVILLLLIIVLKNGSLADKWEQVCFYFSQKDIQNQGKKIHIVNYVDSQCSCSQKPAIRTDICVTSESKPWTIT